MGVVEVLMPRMGESVMEGTILKWLKQPGESIEEEDALLEVATDKVDTEIPCPYSGVIKELKANEGDVVAVDSVIALIETDAVADTPEEAVVDVSVEEVKPVVVENREKTPPPVQKTITPETQKPLVVVSGQYPFLSSPVSGRFYSPLVLNIATKENISMTLLEYLPGTGKDNRVTKKDILAYIDAGKPSLTLESNETIEVEEKSIPVKVEAPQVTAPQNKQEEKAPVKTEEKPQPFKPAYSISGEYDIIEMDRTRKIIAERMLESKKISPHVTSFVEADVTNIVYWRNRMKQDFKDREDTILTYTPIFIEAVVKAIKDYPKINVSVQDDKIIMKKDINIGLAVALQDGNLIVPVIKNADQLNIVGLTKKVNDLAKRARKGKLKPDELEGGTYTVSNVGSFGNVMGTPILVQPQVGILALGAVVKKPAVIETDYGDTIGIRHMMFLSHSYDHRVVDGSLGGMFVRRVADYLEKFDLERKMP